MIKHSRKIIRYLLTGAIVLGMIFCDYKPVGVLDIPINTLITDTLINVDDTITIDASAATKILQGSKLSYSWSIDFKAHVSDTTQAEISFSASIPGRYKIIVTIFESDSIAAYGTAIITVQSDVLPAAVMSISDTTIYLNDTLSISCSSPADSGTSGTVEYHWFTNSTDGKIVGNGKPEIQFTSAQENSYTVFVYAYSGFDTSKVSYATVTVMDSCVAIARIGSDRTMQACDTITLDAGKSYGDKNTKLGYKWLLINGGWLSDDTSDKPLFSASAADTYMVALMVNDGTRTGRSDTLSIFVNNFPVPKIIKAIATGDTLIAVGDTANIYGSRSIEESETAIGFKWQCLSGELVIDSFLPHARFTTAEAGSYIISLIVFDSINPSNYTRTFIPIQVISDKPVADAGNNLTVMVDSSVKLDGRKCVSNLKRPLVYSWHSSFPDGSIINPTDSMPAFTSSEPNTYPISLVVYNGKYFSDTDWVFVTVRDTSIGLQWIVTPYCTTFIGKKVRLNGCESKDSNTVGIQYLWEKINGGEIDSPTICNPFFHANNSATYFVSLRLFSGKDTSTRAYTTIVVNDSNEAPSAGIGLVGEIQINQIVEINGSESSDPNGDKLLYRWKTPAGGRLSFTSDSSKPYFSAPISGDYIILLSVSDGFIESPTVWLTISVADSQITPSANAGNDDSISLGDSMQLDGSESSDGNGDHITYKWQSSREVKLLGDTSEKPWFLAEVVGEYLIGLRVFDGKDSSDNVDWVKIKVKDTSFIPLFKPTAIIAGIDTSYCILENDTVYLEGINSTHSPNTPLKYIWQNAGNNPEKLRLDSVPNQQVKVANPGSYTFILVVFDGYYYSQPVQKTIQIYKPKLYVSNSPKTPWAYQTIQSAVDKAVPYDTVLIGQGTYNENIIVKTSDITLLGISRKKCIVDSLLNGGENTSIITLDTVSNVIVKNLTITHGSAKPNCASIRLYNCNNVYIIENDIVYNNTDGIRSFNTSNLIIRKNTISNNTYNGIRTLNTSLYAEDNLIENNSLDPPAETGDFAIETDNGFHYACQVINNTITGPNSSTFKKDQIKILGPADVIIRGNTISSIDRYSIFCTPNSHTLLTVENNSFRNAKITGIFCFDADSLHISNNSFVLETPRLPDQKGIDLLSCFKGTIESNTIEDFLFGIQTNNSPPVANLDSLVIMFNTLTNDSIGIYARGARAPGVHDNLFFGCDTSFVDSTNQN